MVLAARLAADRVEARKTRAGLDAEWPLERQQLGKKMKRALGELGVPPEDVGLEAIPITQGWDPPPGNLDLTVGRTGDNGLWLAAELKLESVNETLWDVFKLTTASTVGGADAGYLIAAAYERTWARSECRILFSPRRRGLDYPVASSHLEMSQRLSGPLGDVGQQGADQRSAPVD